MHQQDLMKTDQISLVLPTLKLHKAGLSPLGCQASIIIHYISSIVNKINYLTLYMKQNCSSVTFYT